ncbi:hypothetical protein D3O62_18695 [Vibrio cholerae]|nr:hypothetical protein [Vibrio cholerae]
MLNFTQFTKDHWIAIAGIVTGGVIAFGLPYWESYWVQTPQLSIEINSISREISDEAGISVQDHLELGILKPRVSDELTGSYLSLFEEGLRFKGLDRKRKGIVTTEQLRDMLEAAKDELKALPERIENAQEQLDDVKKLKPDSLSIQELVRLNRPLLNEVDVSITEFQDKMEDIKGNESYFNGIINQFIEQYNKKLNHVEERYTELQTNLPASERKVETLIDELKRSKSFFRVSAVLTNSGKSSISIKRPALLRVYIGTGNYVDLKMELEDYHKSAEVKSHGTSIASFKSKEISTIPHDDQKLINTYWGQSVHAILFTEDILSSINASNPIAFSEGLYQKIIYDRLEGEASSKKYFTEQY